MAANDNNLPVENKTTKKRRATIGDYILEKNRNKNKEAKSDNQEVVQETVQEVNVVEEEVYTDEEKAAYTNYIHTCNIRAYDPECNVYTDMNIFAYSFYYLQNGYLTEGDNRKIPGYEDEDGQTVDLTDEEIDCVKALLFLHTIPYQYDKLSSAQTKLTSFFNNTNSEYGKRGGVELVPYGYLLFIGGLIWRKQFMDRYRKNGRGIDPIRYNDEKSPFMFSFPLSGEPLLMLDNKTKTYRFAVKTATGLTNQINYSYVSYENIVCIKDNPFIENKLVDMFKEFVNDDFQKIKSRCELKICETQGNPSNNVYNLNSDITYTQQQSYSLMTDNRRMRLAVFNDISILNQRLRSDDVSKSTKLTLAILKGGINFGVVNKNGVYVNLYLENFYNYVFGCISKSLLHTFFSEDPNIQIPLQRIYFDEVVVCTMPTLVNSRGVKKSSLEAYFKGYGKVIEYYKTHDEKTEVAPVSTEEKKYERDLKCAIYIALKNVWDRWLCGFYNQKDYNNGDTNAIPGREFFNVENFFGMNFQFIDSFYVNIFNKLRLNCALLEQEYNSTGGDDKQGVGKTVVVHIGNVASAHKCMMFNFPDALNFADMEGVDEKRRSQNMVDAMVQMFTPIPSNQVERPEYSNKFTIIYANSANILETNRDKFVPDTFDIFSYKDGQNIAPAVFNCKCEGVGETVADRLANNSRIAYKVPSFGVAYSRQNNSYWKNVEVGMDNMSVTEQAIRAESYIAEKGNTNQRKICFYGQDIYSIYQMYSYLVTVEMLGDAQIQPLMYFQLMNIPMFRGTYMIIKVEHSITKGMMITRFTGVKMSRRQPPMTTSWFTVSPDDESMGNTDYGTDSSNDGEAVMTSEDGVKIDLADNIFSQAIIKHLNDNSNCDKFVIDVYGDPQIGVRISNKLKDGIK